MIAESKSTSHEPLREFGKHLLSFNPNVTVYRADDRDEAQMGSSFEGGGVLLDLLPEAFTVVCEAGPEMMVQSKQIPSGDL